jgi:hypothetical protein
VSCHQDTLLNHSPNNLNRTTQHASVMDITFGETGQKGVYETEIIVTHCGRRLQNHCCTGGLVDIQDHWDFHQRHCTKQRKHSSSQRHSKELKRGATWCWESNSATRKDEPNPMQTRGYFGNQVRLGSWKASEGCPVIAGWHKSH